MTFELDEYRKYLSRLVQTRFLGIDGTLRKKKSHVAAPVIAAAIVQQQILAPMAGGKKKGPSKTVVGANEEIKRGEFAKPLLPMRLTKTALSVLDKDDKRSDCGSIVSVASNKTTSGAYKRHCEPCGFILIDNPSRHKSTIHKG